MYNLNDENQAAEQFVRASLPRGVSLASDYSGRNVLHLSVLTDEEQEMFSNPRTPYHVKEMLLLKSEFNRQSLQKRLVDAHEEGRLITNHHEPFRAAADLTDIEFSRVLWNYCLVNRHDFDIIYINHQDK